MFLIAASAGLWRTSRY